MLEIYYIYIYIYTLREGMILCEHSISVMYYHFIDSLLPLFICITGNLIYHT